MNNPNHWNIYNFPLTFPNGCINNIKVLSGVVALADFIILFIALWLTCSKNYLDFKSFSYEYIPLRRENWAQESSLVNERSRNPKGQSHHFYWNVYAKTGKWTIMYLCIRNIDVVSFYNFDIWFFEFFRCVVCFVFQFICPLPTSFGHISYKDVQSILHSIYRRLHWQLKKNYRAQAWAHKTSIIPTTFWNMCTNHVAWAECHVNSLCFYAFTIIF